MQNKNNIVAEWQKFYHEFGVDCDLSNIAIPDDPGGFDRVIIMAQGVTSQLAYDFGDKNFPCWRYTRKNLDKVVLSERTAQDGAYAIRVRNRKEADEELKNYSYGDLKRNRITGITLEEREIFELKFFNEKGEHLDELNYTLCSGSLSIFGFAIRAFWFEGAFRIFWYSREDGSAELRSRQVIF